MSGWRDGPTLDDLLAGAAGYEVLEEGTLPRGGATYRLRRRVDPGGYWQRLRDATRPPPPPWAPPRMIPAPKPLPEVLQWVATRLDLPGSEQIPVKLTACDGC